MPVKQSMKALVVIDTISDSLKIRVGELVGIQSNSQAVVRPGHC